MPKRAPFSYIGGKYKSVEWIVKHLPETHKFCDGTGGTGVVIINKKNVPIEIFNDLNENIINFYRVLREQFEEFVIGTYLTPYSRKAFYKARDRLRSSKIANNLQRALDFFTVASQCYGGIIDEKPRWGVDIKLSNRGIAHLISAQLSRIDLLPEIVNRFRIVELECIDILDLIEMQDSSRTLFYLDPPYYDATQDYCYQFDEKQYIQLFKILKNINGQWALSGYHSSFMDNHLSNYNFIEKQQSLRLPKNRKGSVRIEVLWTNYDLNNVNNDLSQCAITKWIF